MWYNINRTGRLGNRLFSRAHIYAAALEYKETVIDWGLLDIKNYFPYLENTKIPIYPLNKNYKLKNLPDNLLANKFTLNTLNKLRPRLTGPFSIFWNQHYGKGSFEDVRLDSNNFKYFIKQNNTIILNGYKFICTDWVKKYRPEICEYFKVPQSYTHKWQKLIRVWKEKFSEIIGIHMRRGDFETAMRGDFYLSPYEYAKILKERTDIDYKKTLILVFSEDKFIKKSDWENFQSAFSFTNFILNNGTIIDDLTGLMHTDRIIGPKTSTFSRWCGFIGNKPWAGIGRKSINKKNILQFKRCPIPFEKINNINN
tara:strand:+ start:280 stop:1215 length:936 start_codon:yes stop_codon:yes gene_type:complete